MPRPRGNCAPPHTHIHTESQRDGETGRGEGHARCSRSLVRASALVILLKLVAIFGRDAESRHFPLCLSR